MQAKKPPPSSDRWTLPLMLLPSPFAGSVVAQHGGSAQKAVLVAWLVLLVSLVLCAILAGSQDGEQ